MSSIEKGPIDKGELSAHDKAMLEVPSEDKEQTPRDTPDNFVGSALAAGLTNPSSFNELENPYIKKYFKAKDSSSEERAKNRAEWFKPEVKYKVGKKGKVSINSNGFDLNFDYRPLDSSTMGQDQRGAFFLQDELKIMELGNLSLSKRGVEDQKGRPLSINIRQLLPDGYRVFFNPFIKGNGRANVEAKMCVIDGPLTSPSDILALLHEIGHAYDYQNRQKDFDESSSGYADSRAELRGEGPINEKTLEELLKSERNAWAFALKTIKPYLDNEPYRAKSRVFSKEPQHHFSLNRKMVLDFIHSYCLSTYSNKIIERVEPNLVKAAEAWLGDAQDKKEPVHYGANWTDDIKF